MSPSESMAEAKLFASKHLSELAIEIIDWKRTGLLCGGAGGLLREMAQILGLEYHSLQIAESIVSDLALVAVATLKPEGRTCETREILPCPFCGGKAERIDIDATDEAEPDAGGSFIQCSKCLASSKLVFGEKTGLEEAWNTRQPAARDGKGE